MSRYILMFGVFSMLLLFIQGNTNPKYSETLTENVAEARAILNRYDSLLKLNNVPAEAFVIAFKGFQSLLDSNLLQNDSLITIIDFSKPSNEERFFIIDIKKMSMVEKTLVAHGQRSGVLFADDFSNQKTSHKSSLGFYKTSQAYEGKHGYSLQLEGLEEGINDNAKDRAIVIHGAHYVSYNYIKQNGRLGRSFGCPALSYDVSQEIINLIKDGSCLFIYHPSLRTKSFPFQN